MNYFLINEKLPADIRAALTVYGKCIPLPPLETLPFPVCHHPDMLIADIGDTLLIHEEYKTGQEILHTLEIPFVLSHTPVENNYPGDVRLNCFTIRNFFVSGKNVSDDARALAEQKGFSSLVVRQGYAKCSTVIAGGAIATADKNIAGVANSAGIPTLLLSPEHIDIETYDTGFIGGASVLIDEKTIGFFGDITRFAQYEALRDFFESHGVSLISLGKEPLFDYGGAVVFHSIIT